MTTRGTANTTTGGVATTKTSLDTNRKAPSDANVNTTKTSLINVNTPQIDSITIKRMGAQCNDDAAAAAVHRYDTKAAAAA